MSGLKAHSNARMNATQPRQSGAPAPSIVELNTLSCNPFSGWRWRMNEVCAADDERARDLARHHFLIAQKYIIDHIRTALAKYAEYAAMSPAELKLAGARRLGNAAESAFRAFRVMDRIEPAIAAVRKLANGNLAPDLDKARQRIWAIIESVDDVRQKFYAGPRDTERQAFELSRELGPLCDALHDQIVHFYQVARGLYNLPEMVIDGRVINFSHTPPALYRPGHRQQQKKDTAAN